MVRVLVDALNVAFWCGDPPSLRLPLALLAALRDKGFDAVLVFDANAKYQLSGDGEIYAQLSTRADLCVEVPSGRRADDVMLRDARDTAGLIVTRDRFRDYRQRYRKLIDDPARVFGGTVRDDRLRVPTLDLEIALPASTEQGWAVLDRPVEEGPVAGE